MIWKNQNKSIQIILLNQSYRIYWIQYHIIYIFPINSIVADLFFHTYLTISHHQFREYILLPLFRWLFVIFLSWFKRILIQFARFCHVFCCLKLWCFFSFNLLFLFLCSLVLLLFSSISLWISKHNFYFLLKVKRFVLYCLEIQCFISYYIHLFMFISSCCSSVYSFNSMLSFLGWLCLNICYLFFFVESVSFWFVNFPLSSCVNLHYFFLKIFLCGFKIEKQKMIKWYFGFKCISILVLALFAYKPYIPHK